MIGRALPSRRAAACHHEIHCATHIAMVSESPTLPFRTVTPNADGRTDAPVIPKGELAAGVFELVFHAGAYLDAAGLPAEAPRFLDLIPIRFGIADPGEHYHVPLLLAPYSYSTYRGS